MIELNKIYYESCIATMANMPDGFIDLTVTSPPYDNLRTYKNNIDQTWNELVWKPIIKELYRVTKIGGVVAWIVGDATINGSETGTSFKQALWAMECGFNLHDTMIYEKTTNPFPAHTRYNQLFEYMFVFTKNEQPVSFNPMKELTKTGGEKRKKDGGYRKPDGSIHQAKYKTRQPTKTKGNIWKYVVGGVTQEHPATFPEQLANDHIISWSNENDLIYDPFMGSGTTAKMALINNRRFIGSEISEEYCQIANERIQTIQQKLI